MVSTRQGRKPRQVIRESTPSGDSGEDHDPDEERLDPVTARRPKSRAPEQITQKQKGKRPEKRRNARKLSKLLDMPLDVLYEVSYRFTSVTDGMHADASVDILSFPSRGSTANVVGQQNLP